MAKPEGYRNRIGPWLAKREMLARMGVDQRTMVIFDVGANKGDVTGYYQRSWPLATYYLFEPVASALKTLRERFKDNPRVHIIPKAVGDKAGTATFYVGGQTTEMSSLLRRPTLEEGRRYYWHNNFKEIEAEVITLDDFVEEEHIKRVHLIKADIQGAEGLMLEGASKILRSMPPLILYLEVSFVSLYKNTELFFQISARLDKYGYSLFDLYQLGRARVNRQLKYGDAMFVHRKLREKVLDRYPPDWTPDNLKYAMGMGK